MDIKGLSAIVTGGASGLGAGTARLFAASGAKVAVLDLNADSAQKVADEIGGVAFACDVSKADAVEGVMAQVTEAIGVPRIVVNCAGIATGVRVVGKEGPAPLEGFQKVIDINLVGTFNVTRVAAAAMANLEAMADNERGVIINTASVAAFDGQIGQAAYSASKGGVVGMTLPIARELARFGVRVVTIAPGLFETPMLAGMPQKVYDSLIESTLFPKRLGTPEDYAKLALHIVDNPLLNGETIRLDGGVRLAVK